jgi:hypothetical protein
MHECSSGTNRRCQIDLEADNWRSESFEEGESRELLAKIGAQAFHDAGRNYPEGNGGYWRGSLPRVKT